MAVPTAELTRLSTGAPTGYNNGDYNASTNPYGFAEGGHRINLYALTLDVTVVAAWLESEIAPIVGIADEIAALGGLTAELEALAARAADIVTLAGLAAQIEALGDIASQITTVATNITKVIAVANDIVKVAAVEAKLEVIEEVADALANITAVLALADDLAIIANRNADIALLADIEDGTEATNAIQTAAGIATQIVNVSDNSDDVVAVAGALPEVNTLAGIAADVSALGPIAADVTTVADNITDVEAAADNIAAIIAAPAAAVAARKSVRHVLFDSGTADAHPGTGHFRLSFDINAASIGATGSIYHDIVDADGGDTAGWIASWDDVINATGRGNITLVGEADPSITIVLRITSAISSGTGYRKGSVTLLDKSGTITDEDEFTESFQPYGNDAGGGAGSGDVVSTGSVTGGRLVQYSDNTGDVIEDSGKTLSNLFDKTADDLDDITDGATYKKYSATEKTKLAGIEAAADVTDAGNVGSTMASVSTKGTPVDADGLWLTDSAASNVPKRTLWSAIKATLKTYFDTLYSALGHTHAWADLTGKPTTLSGAGITDAQPLDSDLTAIAALTTATFGRSLLTLADASAGRVALAVNSAGVSNLGLAFSVGSNALTCALKQADGSTNASASAPAVVAMRSSTLSSGAVVERTVTGALSLVISSGSTLGHTSGQASVLYWYVIDNAGTLELAVSYSFFGQSGIVSTTAEGGAGAADSGTVMYSTTARSNVPFRLIGRTIDTQTTAGTWAAAPTEALAGSVERQPVSFSANKNGSAQGSIASATVTQLTFTTEAYDLGGYYDATNSKWTPPPGKYMIVLDVAITSGVVDGQEAAAIVRKNGSNLFAMSQVAANSVVVYPGAVFAAEANGTDYFEAFVYHAGAGTKSVSGSTAATLFQGFTI